MVEENPRPSAELDSGEIQLVLLGMAVLGLQSPGFNMALETLAGKIAGEQGVRVYRHFKDCRREITPPEADLEAWLKGRKP